MKHTPDILADGGLIKTNEKLWAVDDPQFIRDVSGAFIGNKYILLMVTIGMRQPWHIGMN